MQKTGTNQHFFWWHSFVQERNMEKHIEKQKKMWYNSQYILFGKSKSMIDPMSSFEIKNIVPLRIFNFDISITNSSLFMILTVLLICVVFFIGTARDADSVLPNKFNVVIEGIFFFVGDILKTNLGKKGAEFFPYMISLFMFIMVGNVFGLFPFAFSFTSQIVVTLGLAVVVFLASIVIGLWRKGFGYFRHFCPNGVPLYLAPFFVVIELMSFVFRPISLGMRLFANMVAGHIMIKVIAGFAVSIAGAHTLSFCAAVPVLVNVFLNLFKLVICVLQAYVFVVLSCIYIAESVEETKC